MAAASIEIVTLASKSEGHFTLRLYVGQTRTDPHRVARAWDAIRHAGQVESGKTG